MRSESGESGGSGSQPAEVTVLENPRFDSVCVSYLALDARNGGVEKAAQAGRFAALLASV